MSEPVGEKELAQANQLAAEVMNEFTEAGVDPAVIVLTCSTMWAMAAACGAKAANLSGKEAKAFRENLWQRTMEVCNYLENGLDRGFWRPN